MHTVYEEPFYAFMIRAFVLSIMQYPTSAVPSDNDAMKEEMKKPGFLPEGLVLDVAVKDLLLRLLEVDPSRRLRSLRTLQTIAFYKGFNFEKVRERKVSRNYDYGHVCESDAIVEGWQTAKSKAVLEGQ